MSRIITVFGATGSQGASVLNAILADGTFTPRAVTRNVSSDSAQKLKARGVEVVQADLWDTESLKKAIAGSEGVFGVTNFWDPSIFPGNPKGEIEQGKNLINASKAVGVKFFVFSSLPSASKLSGGKYTHVLHLDYKAEIEEYLKSSGLPGAIVHTGWFAENLWNFRSLVKTPEGTFELQAPRYTPDALQAVTWVARDLGVSALALFKHYKDKKDILNQTFYAVTEQITYPDFAKLLQDALGKTVTVTYPPNAGIEEADEMFDFQREFGLYRDSAIPDPRLIKLGAKFATLKEFAETEVKERFA